jgi:hypothetical protein
LKKHLEHIKNYMKNDINSLGIEVLSFVERTKGTPQVLNKDQEKLRDGE